MYSLAGSVAGLTGPSVTLMAPHWLVLIGTSMATATFSVAPLFSGFWSLMAVACATGVCSHCISDDPSVLTRGAGTEQQGLSVGLRATMNRTASLTVPIAMGAIVSATTLATGFSYGSCIIAVTGLMNVSSGC